MNAKEYTDIASNPVFFERNRVFRVYTGGKLFHGFFGDEDRDGCFPEEWIASGVRALNRDFRSEHEGISRIHGKDLYFDQLLKDHKEQMLGERESFDILVKILDSAIRLPAQVHPDKAFSKEYFKSGYGKTEMWLVLSTRENAKIYFGLKNGISREDFASAIEKSESDKNIMESFLNEIPVKKGDVYLIPPKAVHAIGYGCLILEVQEPTDFTIQPEAWCGEYHLNEYEMYLGLKKEQAMKCFDFSICGTDAVGLGRKQPAIIKKSGIVCSEQLISYQDTVCFSVNRHRLTKGSLILKDAPSVYIVTEGLGVLEKEGFIQPVKKGDYFFLPYSIRNQCKLRTTLEMEFVECLPSMIKK